MHAMQPAHARLRRFAYTGPGPCSPRALPPSPGTAPSSCRCPLRHRSVDGEAVEQAVAARALQIGLAVATIRAARGMRRILGFRSVIVAQSLPVVVPDHCRACAALGPVATGAVFTGGKRSPVRLRAGQDVVAGGGFGAAGHPPPPLV